MEAREGGELEKDGGGPHLFFIHKLSHVVSQAKRKGVWPSPYATAIVALGGGKGGLRGFLSPKKCNCTIRPIMTQAVRVVVLPSINSQG